MFLDFHNSPHGWIEVVCGPMFSGKSEELIRRLRRAVYARRQVLAIKPAMDVRYEAQSIASHNAATLPCETVQSARDIPALIRPEHEVIGIDEAQFLGPDLVPVVESLADRGLRVICAGLDQDFRGLPWPPMPDLLARADSATKLQAICMVCGRPATRTQRLNAGEDLVLIGAADTYEARCRGCHTVAQIFQAELPLVAS
jgi:thymidine kinase